MRNTAKHWVRYPETAMKAVAKKPCALHFTGSKTSCEQMEEMLNDQRQKTNKKVPKRSNDLTKGWNQLWKSFNRENGAA